jgi:hypothetical protein
VIKETNLFLAVPNVLALFPDAPVVVLTRSPLGAASSFARGNLFERWDYRVRYRQIVAATRHADAPLSAAAALVPDDDPPDLVALARLHTLNTLLLAAALDSRPVSLPIMISVQVIQHAQLIPTFAGLALDRGRVTAR